MGGAPGGSLPPSGPPAAAGGMTDNVASALCYVLGLITGILFLVLSPYNQNKTVRFHAFQSISSRHDPSISRSASSAPFSASWERCCSR
jgi:hypothetical protein